MEAKKFLLASAAASGVLAAGSLVWYGLLRDFYKSQSARGGHRSRPSLSADTLARVVYGVGLAVTYPRSRSNARTPEGKGFRTGLLVGALASIPSSLSEYGGKRMSLRAALATAGFETLLGGLAGSLVGSIYGYPVNRRTDEDMAGYVSIDREPAEGPIEDEPVHHFRKQGARAHNGR
ncbi:MAG TPA: hypothetical protein VGL38_04945 [bacterium]|jgi:hypothetical protein